MSTQCSDHNHDHDDGYDDDDDDDDDCRGAGLPGGRNHQHGRHLLLRL